jgi:DNA-binding NarL/FixJ family response regulator
MTVRVLVADDHPVYRHGLTGVLGEHDEIEIVGEATDGEQALALALQLKPDVVLMDLHMPTLNGVEATRRLAAEAPGVGVFVLTMFDDDQSVLAAMRAGARGYLVKGAAGDAIVGAARAVAAGEAIFGADVARRVLGVLAEDRRGGRAGRPLPHAHRPGTRSARPHRRRPIEPRDRPPTGALRRPLRPALGVPALNLDRNRSCPRSAG